MQCYPWLGTMFQNNRMKVTEYIRGPDLDRWHRETKDPAQLDVALTEITPRFSAADGKTYLFWCEADTNVALKRGNPSARRCTKIDRDRFLRYTTSDSIAQN